MDFLSNEFLSGDVFWHEKQRRLIFTKHQINITTEQISKVRVVDFD